MITTAKMKIWRNLLMLGLMILLVFITQRVRSAENEQRNEPINEYLQMIRDDKQFETECEREAEEEAGEEELEPLFDLQDDVEEVFSYYHEVINCLFNKKIKKMVALGITGKPEDLEKMLAAVTPPEVITDENGQVLKRGDCVTENLSTYCIAMAGIEEYAKLKDAMVDARNKAVAEVGQRFETLTKKNPQDANNPDVQFEQNKIIRPGGVPLVGGIADIFRGQQNLQSYGEKINRIDRELDLARQALDQGLAAYSELQMSLPMHYKLKDMMKKLEAYRDKISDVRRQVELYPSSFLDVTTTQCT